MNSPTWSWTQDPLHIVVESVPEASRKYSSKIIKRQAFEDAKIKTTYVAPITPSVCKNQEKVCS